MGRKKIVFDYGEHKFENKLRINCIKFKLKKDTK